VVRMWLHTQGMVMNKKKTHILSFVLLCSVIPPTGLIGFFIAFEKEEEILKNQRESNEKSKTAGKPQMTQFVWI